MRTLIVAPWCVHEMWRRKLIELLGLDINDIVVIDRKKRAAFLRAAQLGRAKYYIIHYEGLRLKDMQPLQRIPWFHIIADEVHRIKSPKALQTKAFKRLKCQFKTGASGSIADDRPQDFWSPLNWARPDLFPNVSTKDPTKKFVTDWCNPPEAPIWMADGTFKPIGDIVVGDEVLGWETNPDSGRRRLCVSTVQGKAIRQAPLVEALLESGRTVRCTPDHKWLSAGKQKGSTPWITVTEKPWVTWKKHNDPLFNRNALAFVVEPLPELTPEMQSAALWLGGFLDGEGTVSEQKHAPNGYCSISVGQSRTTNPEVCARLESVLDLLGIPYGIQPASIRAVDVYQFRGGRETRLKILFWCNTSKHAPKLEKSFRTGGFVPDYIVNVRTIPGEHEVVSMQTTSGNYIAWGYASKNCATEEFEGRFLGVDDEGNEMHQMHKRVTGMRQDRLGEFHELIAPFYMRRLKEDVLDLPEKYFSPINVKLYPSQQKVYDALRKEFLAWIGEHENEKLEVPSVLGRLIRLQQATLASLMFTDTGKVDRFGEPIKKVSLREPSAKLDAFVNWAEDVRSPVVVFSQSRGMIELTAARLDAAGARIGVYTGSTPDKVRQSTIDNFGAGKLDFFLATIKAGGEGVDGLQRVSSTAVFFDRAWGPFRNKQAEDRLHREGQRNAVQIVDFYAPGTVDAKVRKTNITKWNQLRDILGDRRD